MKLLLRIIGWILFGFFLYLKITEYKVLETAGIPVANLDILANLYIFFISLNTIVNSSIYLYRRRKGIRKGKTDNIIAGSQNIYFLLLGVGLVVAVLSLFGVDIAALLTSLAVVAAALAILSKDYVSNIISGMLIAFANEINIDDTVQIAGQKGKVIDITLSKFVLLNEDDDMVFIPNNTVFSNEIVNYTKREIKKTSIDFEINLQYVKSIPELEQDLVRAISNYHHEIKPNSFVLRIVEIKKDAVSMKFQYILNEPNRELERDIRKVMVRHVVHIIKEHQNRVTM